MTPLPTVFVSHGAPPFAVEPGQAGPASDARWASRRRSWWCRRTG